MARHHFKSNVVFSDKPLKVDRKRGIIRNVCIVEHGKNKNGTYFNDDFLKDVTIKGNEQKQGVKSRFGHPNMCSSSLGSYLGRYKNFSQKNRAVYADLYLDPISKKTQVEGKGISMFDYVIEMAENNPDMFGNSIHINSDLFEEKVGDVYFNSHKLESLIASDLVDDPAATSGLFSNSNDLGIIVTEFLDNNPTIFETIQRDPSILTDFFDRYNNYLSNFKNNAEMSFLKSLQKRFSKRNKFDVEETTATGDIITVLTDNETPAVGDAVVDAEGVALEDGDVTLKDGTVWTIENGVISEIKEAEEDEGGDEDGDEAGDGGETAEFSRTLKRLENLFARSQKENEKAFNMIADEVGELNKRFSVLARSVKSQSRDYNAETHDKKRKFNQSGYDPDKARELRENQKK